MSNHRPMALGGPLFTRPYLILLSIVGLGVALALWRFFVGLGATTALNDGYPWGIWIAFDVVTGTALAAGGYGVALLIYIFNKGVYHPLIRSAIVTTALGYTIAGVSIIVDVGRFWNIWKVPLFFWGWNFNSALLEVALCVMAYMVVSWVELGPSAIEQWKQASRYKWLTRLSSWAQPKLKKALPFIIALGILLPTLHQSSLGTILIPTVKLHPLWHSPILPVLFLISCLGMGFAGVILESSISGMAFKLKPEWKLLARLSKAIAWVLYGYVALRIIDLNAREVFTFQFDRYALLFTIEIALFLAAATILVKRSWRENPGVLFLAAMLTVIAGALYRFDVYLVAFNPGPGWSYFPSVTETLITVAFVAAEIAAYVYIVKRFPILSARPLSAAPPAIASIGPTTPGEQSKTAVA